MSPYYRYKKEKFLERYQSATDNLANLEIFLEESKDKVILKYKNLV
ncbi:hypothetical protein [Clostridium perfringens]